MTTSATGLRERKRLRTADALTAQARRCTSEDGLHGFTVEQLCETVGVSRRTFFNYFASKEDAVLGLPVRQDPDGLDDAFRGGGTGARGASGLSVDLLDDMVALAAARWELDGVTPEEAVLLLAAVEREPRLLTRLLERSRVQEAGDIVLVEERERLPSGDLRAAAVVQVMGSVFRAAVQEFLTQEPTVPLGDVLRRRLAAVRSVFSL